jgi:hypothetical protein
VSLICNGSKNSVHLSEQSGIYKYTPYHEDGDESYSVMLVDLSIFQFAWHPIPEDNLDTYHANLKPYMKTNSSGKI